MDIEMISSIIHELELGEEPVYDLFCLYRGEEVLLRFGYSIDKNVLLCMTACCKVDITTTPSMYLQFETPPHTYSKSVNAVNAVSLTRIERHDRVYYAFRMEADELELYVECRDIEARFISEDEPTMAALPDWPPWKA